jgi:RNA polymerase sigma factor (sigma-70 family)
MIVMEQMRAGLLDGSPAGTSRRSRPWTGSDPLDSLPDELGDLYRALAGQVRQTVRCSVRAPDTVIDDACQIAWDRLLRRWGDVSRETALPWLIRTANREALRLLRRAARDVPLDRLYLNGDQTSSRVAVATPSDQIAEFRAKLDLVRALPQRQQRLIWLQGFGFSYAEMADYTGATTRTVERQLMRAKRALRRSE